MNLFVLVRVAETGDYEPNCSTAVALSETDAVAKLLELGDEQAESFEAPTLKDPFGLAQEMSGEGIHYYVELHEVQQ
jgi:hypothetical protein